MDSTGRLLKQLYTGAPSSADLLPMLEKAVADYPYFATARLAWLEAVYPARSQKASNLVADTALRIPERRALFRVLHPETAKLSELLSGERPSAGEEVITLIRDCVPEQVAPQEIIERFLAATPKIIPKEVVDYQEDTESDEADNHPLVTETLAEIFASQGHTGKARQIYQILQLKFPEKSSYFADRIRELS